MVTMPSRALELPSGPLVRSAFQNQTRQHGSTTNYGRVSSLGQHRAQAKDATVNRLARVMRRETARTEFTRKRHRAHLPSPPVRLFPFENSQPVVHRSWCPPSSSKLAPVDVSSSPTTNNEGLHLFSSFSPHHYPLIAVNHGSCWQDQLLRQQARYRLQCVGLSFVLSWDQTSEADLFPLADVPLAQVPSSRSVVSSSVTISVRPPLCLFHSGELSLERNGGARARTPSASLFFPR